MATKNRVAAADGDDGRPSEKEIAGFVKGETDAAQRRNLGHNDEASFPDISNEIHRIALDCIEKAEPGKWKALAKKIIRGRDFVELIPTLAPGLAPDSPWARRMITESYGEALRTGVTHPDEIRKAALGFFIMRGGHPRVWALHHEGNAHLQEPTLFNGSDYDDFEDADPSGAEAVADERAEGAVEAVEAQVDFGALEWERLTPRQRIVAESLAYLDLRPYEIATSLGVSKATISSDMNVIRDWLLWHKTTPPPDDPPDPTGAAAKDIA